MKHDYTCSNCGATETSSFDENNQGPGRKPECFPDRWEQITFNICLELEENITVALVCSVECGSDIMARSIATTYPNLRLSRLRKR